MRTTYKIILFAVLIALLVAPASAAIKACLACNSTCNTLPGLNSSVTVNYTFTGAPGSMASVVNIGTLTNALLDFTIPTGATGATGPAGSTGPAGANGTPGQAATIAVNHTFTGAPGSNANVTNVGTSSAALLDFTIPGGSSSTSGLYANNTEVMFNKTGNISGSPCLTFNATTGVTTACYLAGDGTAITNVTAMATAIMFPVREEGTGTIYKGQAVYVSGSTGINTRVGLADNTNSAKTRVAGLMYAQVSTNGAGQVLRYGELSGVDTRATNTAINPLGQTWAAGDLLFATTGGGMTNVRPTSGRSVKVAYSLRGSHISDTLLAYPLENPVWITDAVNENVTLRLGDTAGATYVSIRDYNNADQVLVNSDGQIKLVTGNNVTGIKTIVGDTDAVNKSYMIAQINSSPSSGSTVNDSYLPRDLSQSVTGIRFARSVNTSSMQFDAGTGEAGSGSEIWIYGKSQAQSPGNISFFTPDATNESRVTAAKIYGGYNPKLDMVNNPIVNVKDPSSAQDAATKAYVDIFNTFSASNGSTTQTYVSGDLVKYTNEITDTASYYDPATSRFTPLTSGYYYIQAQVQLQATLQSAKYHQFCLVRSATGDGYSKCGVAYGTGAAGISPYVTATMIGYFNGTSADYVSPYMYTDSTGTRIITGADSGARYIQGYLIRSL